MSRNFKLLLFVCSTVFCLWWFVGFKSTEASLSEYPRQDYVQDVSKIYFDLGCTAQKRNDHKAAFEYFEKALEINPDHIEAAQKIQAYKNH
jgi:tetratricopeptide (TPR) repeat protein